MGNIKTLDMFLKSKYSWYKEFLFKDEDIILKSKGGFEITIPISIEKDHLSVEKQIDSFFKEREVSSGC